MTTLILAAGESERWGGYLGTPKHLVQVHGQPLLHRTIHQLNRLGVTPRVVVRPNAPSDYFLPGALYATPEFVRHGLVQEQEGSRYLWGNRTTILYGDTVYSDDLIHAIVKDSEPGWRVYGRKEASAITGKPYGEMFGWVIDAPSQVVIDAAREYIVKEWLEGRLARALGWEVYRRALGFDLLDHRTEPVHFVEWDDESDDIDYPEDYDERVIRGLA